MKQFFIPLFLAIAAIEANGQSLKGVVLNHASVPLPGVNIVNISNNGHAHSNEQGLFTLQDVSLGDTLSFSHIGYETLLHVVAAFDNDLTIVLNEKTISLDEVVVGRGINALNIITNIDIQTNPVNSSQEILQMVPGLFIGQHAGGGKAEQIFLRGFDIDHGTDINITVDDLPVNMVSHAHGQGYSDLHFLIPETIEKIDFGKGPYYAGKGNFATAGYVNFQTMDKLKESSVKMEAGQFNTYRLLSMLDLISTETSSGYLATEYLTTDGPFDSPQNFNRLNIFGKYTGQVSSTDQIGVTLSHFKSKWDASGQIPVRAVESGLIGRFGAIDDTEGGSTSRTNLMVRHQKIIDKQSFIKNVAFASTYDFELYSNFTFFLEDPVNGDQIRQKENRTLYGLKSTYHHGSDWGKVNAEWRTGIELRYDQSLNNELSHSLNRTETLDSIQLGHVNETNLAAFVDASFDIGKWRFSPGLRIDHFDFQYNNLLETSYQTLSATKAVVSPKFNIFYNASPGSQFYLKTGKGFHSNDTRVITNQTNNKIVPAAYGLDAGVLWKLANNWLVNLAYWYLFSEQEFVYVGDAGIVEPSGESQRNGIDLGLRYQPTNWLFWNLDVNYAHARAIEEASSEDYIPLAPDFTLVSGLNFRSGPGLFGNINLRYIKDRPANENNSIIAEGYTVVDLNVGYNYKNYVVGVQIQNLFDTEWNEAQFATESRLFDETESTEEIHFTPGTPLFLKVNMSVKF